MDEELLQPFLDKAGEDAKAEIREKGILSEHNAIALLMKIMLNHVSELYAKSDNLFAKTESLEKRIIKIESNMATKDDIANMATKDDIEALKTSTKDDMKELKNNFRNWLMYGVAIIAVIITLVSYFLR